MARDYGDEVRQLDLAFLFGKIKRPRYLQARKNIIRDAARKLRGN